MKKIKKDIGRKRERAMLEDEEKLNEDFEVTQ